MMTKQRRVLNPSNGALIAPVFSLCGLSMLACAVMALSAGAFAQDAGMVNAVDANGQADPSIMIAEEFAPPAASAAPPVSNAAPAPVSASASAPQPPQESLKPLPDHPALQPVTESGEASGGNVLGDTGARARHSGQFYDAGRLTPDPDLARAGLIGPRKVDPKYEPGQKFITVHRDATAGSYEGQFVAATRALKLARYAAAMEMFERLYQQNSSDPRVLLGLAVAQQGAGFIESAARTYEDLLRIEPNSEEAIVNLMGIMKSQYPAITLKNLMDLRSKYPHNPGIPAQIGLVSAQMQNYDDALRFLDIAASMEPRNPSHVYNMAIIVDRMNDPRNAVKFYERALQLDASYGSTAKALPRDQIYDRLSVLRNRV